MTDFETMLMYATIRIDTTHRQKLRSGTGFFFDFQVDSLIPCIITNNHVVRNADNIKLRFHLANDNGQPINRIHEVDFCNEEWMHISHPNPDIDLCALYVPKNANLNQKVRNHIFTPALSVELIPKEGELLRLNPVNEVLMVGYPIGLSDYLNNFPIFRRGTTATHPAVNYNGNSEFLIDAACWPGSSGSPIFNYGMNVGDRYGNVSFGTYNPKLWGILWGGPLYTAKGEIRFVSIPMDTTQTSQTKIPVNLGCVIKSKEIFILMEEVRKKAR